MEIRNVAGTTINRIPVTLRLRIGGPVVAQN